MLSLKVIPRSLFLKRLSHNLKAIKTKMLPTPARNYQDAIEALNNLQSNYQYIKNAAVKPPRSNTNIADVTKYLKRTGLAVEELDKLSVIHIAGTNGKGTTCAYCERILRNHGYSTGFYSSPHLLNVRERIRINGKPISENEFATHFWRIYYLLDAQKANPTDMPLYFRYLTIMAIHVFLEHKVDVAILEVGIGGEYDCTNVVRNTVVAGITPLDLDHTSLLGHSIEAIAWNKAGIMKKGCVAFTAQQPDAALQVLRERSVEKNCALNVVDINHYANGPSSQIPVHVQQTNASLALAISEAFIKKDSLNNNAFKNAFSLELAKKSIEETHWPGRYEIKQLNNIRFFLDGAHTIESITVCANWFSDKVANSTRKRALIFNLTGGRNPDVFFKELCKQEFNVVIFTPNVGSEKDLADTVDFILPTDAQLQHCEEFKTKWLEVDDAKKVDSIRIFTCFSKAVDSLDDGCEYDVLVTGSIHLIGAALSVLDPTLNGLLND